MPTVLEFPVLFRNSIRKQFAFLNSSFLWQITEGGRGGRERDRQRERQRETETQRVTETVRNSLRQAETDRQRQTHRPRLN